MKKILLAIGTILIMACVVILFVNANGSKKESRKAKTEATTDKACGTGSAACCQPGADKDATSSAKQEGAQKKAQDCSQMSSCTGTCGSKTTGAK
jgi:hypothetical protein